MSPLLLAAAQAVIQEVLTLISQIGSGKITDAQATEILKQSALSYKAARDNWDAA